MLRVFPRPLIVWPQNRYYATAPKATADIRSRLMSEVKAAMKNKDSRASIAIRSVLSEVYADEKVSNEILQTPAICRILRKSVIRRLDSASRYTQASRLDLAEKENHEAEILSKFLPPLLSEAVIERTLTEIIDALPAGAEKQKYMGKVFKEFYSRVDQSNVDPNIVKKRAAALLARIGG